MRLVLRDIEFANAEGEVDRVEIFEGGRPIRKVKGEKNNREKAGDRDGGPSARLRVRREVSIGRSSRDVEIHAGRRNSPSFRLPVR